MRESFFKPSFNLDTKKQIYILALTSYKSHACIFIEEEACITQYQLTTSEQESGGFTAKKEAVHITWQEKSFASIKKKLKKNIPVISWVIGQYEFTQFYDKFLDDVQNPPEYILTGSSNDKKDNCYTWAVKTLSKIDGIIINLSAFEKSLYANPEGIRKPQYPRLLNFIGFFDFLNHPRFNVLMSDIYFAAKYGLNDLLRESCQQANSTTKLHIDSHNWTALDFLLMRKPLQRDIIQLLVNKFPRVLCQPSKLGYGHYLKEFKSLPIDTQVTPEIRALTVHGLDLPRTLVPDYWTVDSQYSYIRSHLIPLHIRFLSAILQIAILIAVDQTIFRLFEFLTSTLDFGNGRGQVSYYDASYFLPLILTNTMLSTHQLPRQNLMYWWTILFTVGYFSFLKAGWDIDLSWPRGLLEMFIFNPILGGLLSSVPILLSKLLFVVFTPIIIMEPLSFNIGSFMAIPNVVLGRNNTMAYGLKGVIITLAFYYHMTSDGTTTQMVQRWRDGTNATVIHELVHQQKKWLSRQPTPKTTEEKEQIEEAATDRRTEALQAPGIRAIALKFEQLN